jgi:uncharacterized protein YbjT (DUF2867 family)
MGAPSRRRKTSVKATRMAPKEMTVAVAGGSGFIGRAIVRRLAEIPGMRIRLLTRTPDRAREILGPVNVEFVRADVIESVSVRDALSGVQAVVNAVQFEGYPIENPRRGLTFERIDYGGTVAMLKAGKEVAASAHFIYISGAAADETSPQPGFRAKGRAERAIRESGLAHTIFRPSLVYGPDDKVINMIARALRFALVFAVPGTGRQKLQPVLVDDLAACVALALGGRGRNGTFEIGGPEQMTFDELVRLIMELTGRRRPIVHVPGALMLAAGAIAEMMPWALFSRDAANFLTTDNICDIKPLVEEFGIQLTPARKGLAYLASARP